MEANELRIGNLIHPVKKTADGNVVQSDVILVVSAINKHGNIEVIQTDSNEPFRYMHGRYAPVPLTEDLLKAFGVEEKKKQPADSKDWVQYHKGSDTFNYAIGYYWDAESYWDYVFHEIKHAHQLQNLYFALTGKELILTQKIKL